MDHGYLSALTGVKDFCGVELRFWNFQGVNSLSSIFQLVSQSFNINLLFQKITTPFTEGVFGLDPDPSGNSSLASLFLLKTLAFEIPLPLRISNNLSLGRYEYSLKPQNARCTTHQCKIHATPPSPPPSWVQCNIKVSHHPPPTPYPFYALYLQNCFLLCLNAVEMSSSFIADTKVEPASISELKEQKVRDCLCFCLTVLLDSCAWRPQCCHQWQPCSSFYYFILSSIKVTLKPRQRPHGQHFNQGLCHHFSIIFFIALQCLGKHYKSCYLLVFCLTKVLGFNFGSVLTQKRQNYHNIAPLSMMRLGVITKLLLCDSCPCMINPSTTQQHFSLVICLKTWLGAMLDIVKQVS